LKVKGKNKRNLKKN